MQLDEKWLFTQTVTGNNLPYFIFFVEVTMFVHQGFCNQGAS